MAGGMNWKGTALVILVLALGILYTLISLVKK